MKLISIKVLGEDFRSVSAGRKYEFEFEENASKLLPKCFVGLNGSGKSNLFELIAELFFYLDGIHLKFKNKAFDPNAPFGFEIEYLLPLTYNIPGVKYDGAFTYGDEYVQVKVAKPIDKPPAFYIKPWLRGRYVKVEANTQLLLPKKVIAYTSGSNELLSNAFYKMRYHYFNEFEKMNLEGSEYALDDSRMYILDNNTNSFIIIANWLLGETDKLGSISKLTALNDLQSFRITIRYKNYIRNEINFPKKLLIPIERLKRCSTSWHLTGEGKNRILTLDYCVNDALKEAFKASFGTAFDLFKTFYELDMLNVNMVPVAIRELALNPPKWLNLSEEIQLPDPTKLIFRIDKITVTKKNVRRFLKYKSLSDGEHQFLQVVGAVMMMEEDNNLFLLDEPETHYNPLWRSHLISTLNKISIKTGDEMGKGVRKQEILITTHSPFLLSDCARTSVYIASRKRGQLVLKHPEIETYGASVGQLMDYLFMDEPQSIAEMAKEEIGRIRKRVVTAKSVKALENAINDLSAMGNSMEKLNLMYLLRTKDIELRSKN